MLCLGDYFFFVEANAYVHLYLLLLTQNRELVRPGPVVEK